MKNILFQVCILIAGLSACAGCAGGGGKGNVSGPEGRFADIKDLYGGRIGCVVATTQEAFLTRNHPQIERRVFDTFTDVLQVLENGGVDAIALDDYILYDFARNFDNLAVIGSDFKTEHVGAAFPKGKNLELQKQFNALLDELKASPEYDEMVGRWITRKEGAKPMPRFRLPVSGEPVKVGISPVIPGLMYMEGKQIRGFEYELMMRFSERIGRPIDFQLLHNSSIILSIATGKVDMGLSGFYITPERQKNMDFSDPYYDSDTYVAVLARNRKMLASQPAAGQIPGDDSPANAVSGEKPTFFSRVKASFYNNLILEKRYLLICDGLEMTLVISFFAIILGTVLGALVCFGRMCRSGILNRLARGYIGLMRGIPTLVLLLILYYVVFAHSEVEPEYVAILTFALNFAAYVSEMFRTAIGSVGRGQTEAGIALGFSRCSTFLHIVLPQAVNRVLPVYKGEMISLVKMTSIVGYIAVQDLTKASDIIRSRTFDALFPLLIVAVLYFIIAWLFALVLDRIGRMADPHGC